MVFRRADVEFDLPRLVVARLMTLASRDCEVPSQNGISHIRTLFITISYQAIDGMANWGRSDACRLTKSMMTSCTIAASF